MSAYTQTIARAIRKGSDVLTGDDAAVLERDLTEYQDTADTLRAQLDEAVALLRRVYPAGRNATHCDVDLRREACAFLARVDGGAE